MATAPRWLLMGVAGAGKTTVGRALATAAKVPFVDGDDLHPPANVAKMRAGRPLDDADRWPWLAAIGSQLAAAPGGLVVACSALRRSHRDRLRTACPELRIVQLAIDEATAAARLKHRAGHFFPPELLASQFATLEPLRRGLVLDATRPTAELVAAILAGPR